MRTSLLAAGAALFGLLGAAAPAAAGGIEIPENGSLAIGRGGAFTARASDPTALMHNVAGIAGLSGFQITLSANAALMDHCFTRSGNYPSGGTFGTVFESSSFDNGSTPYPRVCNDTQVNIAPQILATYRVHPRFALGLGIYGPNTTGSRQFYPDRVTLPNGQLAPSPARHMVFEKALLLFHVPIAAAWSPTPWLRIGAAIQPSFARFQLGTVVSVAQSPREVQHPSADAANRLDTSGFFLAGNLGVQVLPTPYLSFGLHAHLTMDAVLSGASEVTVGTYATNAVDRVVSSYDINKMTIPLPHTFRFGARFALPRTGRPRQNDPVTGAQYDPMTDDVFDVEFDFNYETTTRMSEIVLENTGSVEIGGGARVPAPTRVAIRSDFTDNWGLRLGGDVNVLPGTLAVRGGVAYERGAVSRDWAPLHIAAYDSVSLHLGASFRWRWLTVSAAYAHYFMPTFQADIGQRTIVTTRNVLADPAACAAAGEGACTVNRGSYEGNLNIFNLGFTGHF